MRHDAIAKKRIDAMSRAVKELIWDDEIQRPMLFLQRPHRRHRNNSIDSELLEAINIRPKIQFARQQCVPPSMARQKCNLAPCKRAQNIRIRRIAEGCLLPHFMCVAEARHVVQTTPADDANFC